MNITAANLTKISDICVTKVLKVAQEMYFYEICLFLTQFSCLEKRFIRFHLHRVSFMVEQQVGVHCPSVNAQL